MPSAWDQSIQLWRICEHLPHMFKGGSAQWSLVPSDLLQSCGQSHSNWQTHQKSSVTLLISQINQNNVHTKCKTYIQFIFNTQKWFQSSPSSVLNCYERNLHSSPAKWTFYIWKKINYKLIVRGISDVFHRIREFYTCMIKRWNFVRIICRRGYIKIEVISQMARIQGVQSSFF